MVDVVRGIKCGCIGVVCFLIPAALFGVLLASTMGISSGDSGGSVAVGIGMLLFIIGNGAWAAFLTLAALAATGPAPTRTAAAVTGAASGTLFVLAIVTVPASRHFWFLPLMSSLFVLASWGAWKRIKPRR